MGFESSGSGQVIEPLNRQAERMKKRRISLWLSVVLPFILDVLAIGAMVVFVARSGTGSASAWSDTSLIFLMIPMLLLCLIPLVLVGLLIYGTSWLIGWLPGPLGSLESGVRRVNRGMSHVLQSGLRPLIILKALWAAIKTAITRLLGSTGRGE
jgi:hypothetical protein